MASSLFREVSFEALAALIRSCLDDELLEARLLTGGLFNTTYRLTARRSGEMVLRLGPVNRHLIMPFEHKLMESEAQVYRLLAGQGVAVPQVMAVDVSKALIGRDFMITRYIPGVPLSEAALSGEDQAGVCRQAGACARRMHGITAPRFGRVADVCAGKGFETWAECLENELFEWESVARPTGMYTPSEHERIRAAFRSRAGLLNGITVPRLVHADLWAGNVLVFPQSPARLAAIIDADRAFFGDSELEFSLGWTANEGFMAGYGRPLSPEKEARERRALYRLLFALWDGYVYQAEYNMPEEMERTRERARALLDELAP